ncbi:hypothetical protein JMJ77_0006004, partial [Colletotrichum scovillei]
HSTFYFPPIRLCSVKLPDSSNHHPAYHIKSTINSRGTARAYQIPPAAVTASQAQLAFNHHPYPRTHELMRSRYPTYLQSAY